MANIGTLRRVGNTFMGQNGTAYRIENWDDYASGNVLARHNRLGSKSAPSPTMIEFWKAKYAPDPDAAGYVEFDLVPRAMLTGPWRGLPEEITELRASAVRLSLDWGFVRPSSLQFVVWKNHQLLADLDITPLPCPGVARGWTIPIIPWAHFMSVSELDGSPVGRDALWKTLMHEFLHRCEFEKPDAFDMFPRHQRRDLDDGECSSVVVELAPIMANFEHATREDRDRILALRAACRKLA